MLIFLTGATGYIGSAVLEAFLRGGHDVTALVRDPEKAEFIASRGVHAVIGDLEKPSSYAAAAERSEVIVHTALDGSSRRDKIDRLAVDTLLAAATAALCRANPPRSSTRRACGCWAILPLRSPKMRPSGRRRSSPGARHTSAWCSTPAVSARREPSSCGPASSTAGTGDHRGYAERRGKWAGSGDRRR